MFRLATCLVLMAASSSAQVLPAPPVAEQRPHLVVGPQGQRPDEYHWLRDDDPKAKRPEVMAYLEAENAYAQAVLAPLQPLRERLRAEYQSRIEPAETTPPAYAHGWWQWREYRPGADHPVLMRQRGSPEWPDPRAPRQVVLDTQARAQGQAYYQLAATAMSPDGRVLAYVEDTTGRRMHTLRFRDLATGADLPDRLDGVLEDLAWAADSRTVFYVRQDPVTLQSGPVWRHRLGTPAEADVMVYDEPDKTLFVGLGNTASMRYVVIHLSGTDTTETRVVDARRPTTAARVALARRPGVRHSADHLRGRWVVRTNEDAPDFRLVSAAQAAPDDRRRWRTLVPARPQATLEDFALFDGGIAVQERVAAELRVSLLRNGRLQPVMSSDGGTVMLGDNRDARAAHLRLRVMSMVQPAATWDVHLASGRHTLRHVRPVPGYDATRYATQRIWAPARDGQRIPVTVAWRPDRTGADGRAPLLVQGYGAYGFSYDPTFSSPRVSLLDRGFVVAIAHVRGGAELGEAWYEAGKLMHKKNSFNDFVDATDALVRAGWGAPDKVFASGGSAGGLLMGVVANEAGQRFRGIVMDVPFVDVISTMLDETIPLTANEWTQWGDPREKAAHDYMLSYSPYDNLRAQDYPAMLVTTGLWDSQVQYFEPAKYVARLRARKTDRNPLLLATNLSAGHGGASGRYAELDEYAREAVFLLWQAGVRE